jgi:hypothetical protein
MGCSTSQTSSLIGETRTSQWDASGAAVAQVEDSFFHDCSTPDSGGAILLTVVNICLSQLQVLRTTFLRCSCGDAKSGGAIYVEAGSLEAVHEFDSVCGRECQCNGYGAFIDFLSPGILTQFTEVSCLSCLNSESTLGYGIIQYEKDSEATFTNLNFTNCFASNRGSAINAGNQGSELGKGGQINVIYFTGLNNRGVTVVDHSKESLQEISFANFYNNQASDGVCFGRNGFWDETSKLYFLRYKWCGFGNIWKYFFV